jgi:hypothetical protein
VVPRGHLAPPGTSHWAGRLRPCATQARPSTVAVVGHQPLPGGAPRPQGRSRDLTSHRSINRRYATLARELGLDVAHQQPIGWSATSVPEPTATRYAEVLAELGAALVLWRRVEQAAPTGPGRSRNALACSCACGRRIRVARSVLELAPDPPRRLHPTLRARGRRGRLTRTSLRLLCPVKPPEGFRRQVGRSVRAVGTAGER